MHQRLVLAALFAILAPVPALAQASGARDNIDALIELQAKANRVPAAFVHKVVKRESNYNPNAKGGSALGLMQIKHATARGLGYKGDAAGLYDPETNLKYGIAYLAGAYRAAKGDIDQAYRYYNRGYYYAAKKLGIETDVADTEAPAPIPAATSATGFASLFGGKAQPVAAPVLTASADSNAVVAGTPALAFAATPATASALEVPLPPQRPASLGGAVETASAEPSAPAQATAPAATPPQPQPQPQAESTTASSDTVEVPLPPRRPSATLLAAIGRPAVAARKPDTAAPVVEATALAPAQ